MKLHVAVIVGLLCAPLSAQMGGPEEKIREIAEEVAQEMKEIDRLLLQSGKSGLTGAAEGMAESSKKIDKRL